MASTEQRIKFPLVGSGVAITAHPVAREVAAHLLNPIFPHKIISENGGEDTSANPFERAEQLMDQNFGIVLEIDHSKMSDPFIAQKISFLLSRKMRKAQMTAPTAAHQMFPGTVYASETLGVNVTPVFTENSKEKMKQPLLKRGVLFAKHKIVNPKRGIPFDDSKYKEEAKKHLTKREGADALRNYLTTAAETLKAGGIVVIAPQGKREARLNRFSGQPIQNLVKAAGKVGSDGKAGTDKIAFIHIGIGRERKYLGENEAGEDVYEDYRISGFEPFKESTVRIGECITLQEQYEMLEKRRAAGEEITLDDLNYELLAAVVPKEYLPELNGDSK